MNKSNIIATIETFRKQHRLTARELVVRGHAVLCLRGLTANIIATTEVEIPEALYDRLKRKGAPELSGGRILVDGVAAHRGLNEKQKHLVVHGIHCFTTADLIAEFEGKVYSSPEMAVTMKPMDDAALALLKPLADFSVDAKRAA